MTDRRGSRVHTNAVYSASAHGEAFKVIPAQRTRLKWPTRTSAPKPISGRLTRTRVNPAKLQAALGINRQKTIRDD